MCSTTSPANAEPHRTDADSNTSYTDPGPAYANTYGASDANEYSHSNAHRHANEYSGTNAHRDANEHPRTNAHRYASYPPSTHDCGASGDQLLRATFLLHDSGIDVHSRRELD